MSETIIHDSTPSGSAILAYGESSSAPQRSRAFLVIIGSIIGLFILFFSLVIWLFTLTIPVPTDAIALAYIRPNAELPNWTPAMWKEAQIRARPFPIFVGFALNQDATVEPFTITRASAHWQLHSSSINVDSRRPLSLSSSWTDYLHPVWLQIWPANLFKLMNTETSSTSSTHFGGILVDHGWNTNAEIPKMQAVDTPLPFGSNSVNLHYLPELWPLIQDLFRNKGITPALPNPPNAVFWTENQQQKLAVGFQFAEPLTSTTKAELAGSFGLTEKKPYALPDNTVVMEQRLPYSLFQTSTTSEWVLENGNKLIFGEKRALFGHPELFSIPSPLPARCKEHVIARFDMSNIPALTQLFHLSATFPLSQFVFIEKNEKLQVCW